MEVGIYDLVGGFCEISIRTGKSRGGKTCLWIFYGKLPAGMFLYAS
jgi:hypothetical protein